MTGYILIQGSGGNGQTYLIDFLKSQKIKTNARSDQDRKKHRFDIVPGNKFTHCIFLYNDPLYTVCSHFRRKWQWKQLNKLSNPCGVSQEVIMDINKYFKLVIEKQCDLFGIEKQFDNWYNNYASYPIYFQDFSKLNEVSEQEKLCKFLNIKINFDTLKLTSRKNYDTIFTIPVEVKNIYKKLYKKMTLLVNKRRINKSSISRLEEQTSMLISFKRKENIIKKKFNSQYIINRQHYINKCDLFINKHKKQDIVIDSVFKAIIKDGMIVGINKRIFISRREKILQSIRQLKFKIILWVIDHSTRSSDLPVGYNKKIMFKIASHANIIKFVCEDWMGSTHSNIIHMPIGIGTKRDSCKNICNYYNNYQLVPFNEKKDLVFCAVNNNRSYTWNDPGEWGYKNPHDLSRKYLTKKIQNNSLVYNTPRVDFLSYLDLINQCKFSISPFGRGPDCHRTWELLALNCIPIVKSSPLDNIYKQFDMPVVIVNDWDEITTDNLKKWDKKFSPYFKTDYIHKLSIDNFIKYN